MVDFDALWNFDGPVIDDVRARRLQEEERFNGGGVVELFDVRGVVPSNRDNLVSGRERERVSCEGAERDGKGSYFSTVRGEVSGGG